jgi:hypothetical protein
MILKIYIQILFYNMAALCTRLPWCFLCSSQRGVGEMICYDSTEGILIFNATESRTYRICGKCLVEELRKDSGDGEIFRILTYRLTIVRYRSGDVVEVINKW